MSEFYMIRNSDRIENVYFLSNSFLNLYNIDGNFLIIIVPDSGENIDLSQFNCEISKVTELKLDNIKPRLLSIAGEFSNYYMNILRQCMEKFKDSIKQLRILDMYPSMNDSYSYNFRYTTIILFSTILDILNNNQLEEADFRGFYGLNLVLASTHNIYEYDDIFCPEDPDEKIRDLMYFTETINMAKIHRNLLYEYLPKASNLYKLNLGGVIYVSKDWLDLLCNIITCNHITELTISLCKYEPYDNIQKIISSTLQNDRIIRFNIQQRYKYVIFEEIEEHLEKNKNKLLQNCVDILSPDRDDRLTIPEISEMIYKYI
jgi:hypothetical protein